MQKAVFLMTRLILCIIMHKRLMELLFYLVETEVFEETKKALEEKNKEITKLTKERLNMMERLVLGFEGKSLSFIFVTGFH